MCTVGSKSRDRTLQDGCLIDECETVTEECIPQGKGVTFPVATFIVHIFDPWDQKFLYFKTLFVSQDLNFMDGIFCSVLDRHSCDFSRTF